MVLPLNELIATLSWTRNPRGVSFRSKSSRAPRSRASRRRRCGRAQSLPGIQSKWGRVLVYPHWGQVQEDETLIPLWPTVLEPVWEIHLSSKDKPSESACELLLQQTMN